MFSLHTQGDVSFFPVCFFAGACDLGGPARKAGLMVNDMIVSVGGKDATKCAHSDISLLLMKGELWYLKEYNVYISGIALPCVRMHAP